MDRAGNVQVKSEDHGAPITLAADMAIAAVGRSPVRPAVKAERNDARNRRDDVRDRKADRSRGRPSAERESAPVFYLSIGLVKAVEASGAVVPDGADEGPISVGR